MVETKHENRSTARKFCCVCRRYKNPIIVISVGKRTFYFCVRHALEAKDKLENQLKAVDHVRKLRRWAEKKGIM